MQALTKQALDPNFLLGVPIFFHFVVLCIIIRINGLLSSITILRSKQVTTSIHFLVRIMNSNYFLQNLASRSLVDDVLRKVNGLKPIADELGVPLSQLAIAWCASNPHVSSVITGATKESQVSFIHLFSKLDLPQICDPMYQCSFHLFLLIGHLTFFESIFDLHLSVKFSGYMSWPY